MVRADKGLGAKSVYSHVTTGIGLWVWLQLFHVGQFLAGRPTTMSLS